MASLSAWRSSAPSFKPLRETRLRTSFINCSVASMPISLVSNTVSSSSYKSSSICPPPNTPAKDFAIWSRDLVKPFFKRAAQLVFSGSGAGVGVETASGWVGSVGGGVSGGLSVLAMLELGSIGGSVGATVSLAMAVSLILDSTVGGVAGSGGVGGEAGASMGLGAGVASGSGGMVTSAGGEGGETGSSGASAGGSAAGSTTGWVVSGVASAFFLRLKKLNMALS